MTHSLSATASLLTAPLPGAIAVVRIDGLSADLHAQLALPQLAAGQMRVYSLRDEQDVIDDALLVAPDAQRIELHLHGGPAVVRRTLSWLEHHGIRIAEPFCHTNLQQGMVRINAAVAALIPHAQSETALRMLAAQPELYQRDVAEQQDSESRPAWQTESLRQWRQLRTRELAYFFNPPRVAIIGPPNAGKSTLANAILGRPVSIISDQPGTTRDWVDASALIIAGGTQLNITLVDTAGMRITDDPIEREAIDRSHAQASAADVVLMVVDASQQPTQAELRQWSAMITGMRRPILVLNKSDLSENHAESWADSWRALQLPSVRLSALRQQNFAELSSAIIESLALQGEVTRERCILQEQAVIITP